MTAIWHNDGTAWRLLGASGFPDERTLHDLIEQTPQMLPLAGTPTLAIVGREVQLGSGYADLIGIESSGQLAVIEIKLARNPEARRAVVSQVLAYAAYLNALDHSTLESSVLGSHLARRGFDSLHSAIGDNGSLGSEAFGEAVNSYLQNANFRIVLVLDDAPPELVRLVGFLESLGDKLTIDLVVVSSFSVGGSEVIVPQRVEPERLVQEPSTSPVRRAVDAQPAVRGVEQFAGSIGSSSPADSASLTTLLNWATSLEGEGLVTLRSKVANNGAGMGLMLGLLPPETVAPAIIWNWGGVYIQLYRSVFERRSPNSVATLEAAIAPVELGAGKTTRNFGPEVLGAIRQAYVEAARGQLHG